MREQTAVWSTSVPAPAGLYDPRFEHDACGVGFIARVSGEASHDIVRKAVEAVANLSHRGAVAADGKSGDGSGVLTQVPRRLMASAAATLGVRLDEGNRLGIGMLFCPNERSARPDEAVCRATVDSAIASVGLTVLGWREVPVMADELGAAALRTLPRIRQVLVAPAAGMDADAFERALFLARKELERRALENGLTAAGLYVASLSSRTLVYKGLFAAHQLPAFYPDLRDPNYESALAVFHQRYSTNTFPTWQLAQPFRLLAHNGEINTLLGNRAWMRARAARLPAELQPVIWEEGSDSTSLDEALDLLERNGRDVVHALSVLMPPAWEGNAALRADERAFYRYHARAMEPWDGPAALAFSDGRFVGAALDRNGLRPCRYKVTEQGLVVACSEVGAIELDDYRIVEKGRLGPGQMFVVDVERHRLLHDHEVKRELAAERPWKTWARPAGPLRAPADETPTRSTLPLPALQRALGYSNEDLRIVLRPMGAEAQDAVWSMGDDTPLAVLARVPRSAYAFFRQRFAQVTNPPIDPLRESLVMSLHTWIGPRPDLLQVDGAQPDAIELDSPVLDEQQLDAIRTQARLPVADLKATMSAAESDLRQSLIELCDRAVAAAEGGARILILSDRTVSHDRAPIPMLLALGAVHQRLIATGLRTEVDLVADAGDAWDVHHLATLIGYGAGAVCPWLALQTARALGDDQRGRVSEAQRIADGSNDGPDGPNVRPANGATRTSLHTGTQATPYPDPETAEHNYLKAANKGLLKIMSKMGISTIASYRGGQIFECLGLNASVVELCFAGTPSTIGGLGFDDLLSQVHERHTAAFASDIGAVKLPDFGLVRFRRDGERHAWEPVTVRALHKMIAANGDAVARRTAWAEYLRLTDSIEQPASLRDLLAIDRAGPSVSVEEVEPASEIVKRFVCTAMSLGALSPEAHETLAVGMNRLGARSNSGEGGEDPAFYAPRSNGDRPDNKIKQVASARFGVTARYLAQAEEMEIKMAQGSKPGEGGQLPAHKVTELIARLRHAVPGTSLISPPPHHDIYSIEDLAQLIYDLKRVNPRGRVGVKLVSQAGVGTVAAGVAKAYADYVLVSGFDGGTGASPLSSIKHAGSPWEMGVAEAQQVLIRNGLRARIRLRTDGGLRRARDVVVAALLGAEEFGFGTASLIAIGCDMARQCHLNTCPTGIATQRPELRAKFDGTPEDVITFFMRLAEDVREMLADLGFRSLDEAVGRVDLLRQVRWVNGIDLTPILTDPDPSGTEPRRCLQTRNDRPDQQAPLDEELLGEAQEQLATNPRYKAVRMIRNRDRTTGARIAGEIGAGRLTHHHPLGRNPEGEGHKPGHPFVELRFVGSAGQSFGAFTTRGMLLTLEGEANDYVGKGMSGGEIVVLPADMARFAPHQNTIIGNTVLYGATGGRLFAAGRAGERFAVRNSGAVAVVEGVGDHGCEYMTGGLVLVLGATGRNFAAGMTNGVAYVLDEAGDFPSRVNQELVQVTRLMDTAELALVYNLVGEHFERTASRRAEAVVNLWDVHRSQLWKVAPKPAIVDAPTGPRVEAVIEQAAPRERLPHADRRRVTA
jgi:glutamate synthase domain-containing protein 2/glutamate synthase domain-containing protein 1/glutamate synthase domain-containing protein 3